MDSSGATAAYAQKDDEYYAASRADMVSFVPESCTRILEVGCGAGGFGELLKRRGKVHVTGVEFDPKTAEKAKLCIDEVVVGDFASVSHLLPDGHFHCAVLNDVIEHVFDPLSLLRTVAAKVERDGKVIASVPNVRYFRVLSSLLFQGDWKYEDSGVLDFTHIRFFTRKSILRLFAEAGLVVETCQPISKTKSLRPFILDLLTWGRFGQDSRFKQFAIVARKNNQTN